MPTESLINVALAKGPSSPGSPSTDGGFFGNAPPTATLMLRGYPQTPVIFLAKGKESPVGPTEISNGLGPSLPILPHKYHLLVAPPKAHSDEAQPEKRSLGDSQAER